MAAQTRIPDRVVLVDDASQDATVERARAWRPHLPLEVVRQPVNGGVARARNEGIGRLDTDVVAILDGDDVLLPDHLEVLSRLHRTYGGVITPRANFWVPGSPPRPYHRRLRGFVPPREDQLRKLVMRNFVFVASLVSRFDLEAVSGFTEGDRAQDTTADWDLWLRLSAKGCPITPGPFPTVLYRVVQGSMADDSSNLLECEIKQLERARSFLPDRLEPVIAESLANRRAELALLVDRSGSRLQLARMAVGRRGGDWRNRARAVAGAASPATANRFLRHRGGW